MKVDISKKKKPQRRKRKISYFRVLIFVIFFSAFIAGLGFLIRGAYIWTTNVINSNSSFVETISPQNTSSIFENYTNILIVGTNSISENSMQADALMLMSVDKKTGAIRFLSLPTILDVKDIGQNTAKDEQQEIINFKDALLDTKPSNFVNQVASFLDIPITKYLIVDTKTIASLVEESRGLNFYVEENMDYEDPMSQTAIHLLQGYQNLNGNEAIQYLRYRSDDLGNIGRVERNERLFKVLWTNLTSGYHLIFLPTYISIIKNNSISNIDYTSLEILPLVYYLGFKKDVQIMTLPGVQDNRGIWKIDKNRLDEKMKELFPENEES